jgi:hypothetical protein
MSYLTSNLSALQQVLGTHVRLPADDGRSRVETVGSIPVLHILTDGGADIALNSRRDPLAEARKVLDGALAGQPEPRTVVAIGVGLGFIIDAIEHRCPAAKILALEPEPGCMRPLLERRDWSSLISSGRLLVLWGPGYQGSSEGWRLIDGSDGARVVVAHPVLSRQRPGDFAAAADLAERMAFGARANAEARKKFAGRYLLNTLRNLPVIARSGDVGALFGQFTGVPGIIVSAGPSLDGTVTQLSEAVGRSVVVAVDTALRPLLTSGVCPHLVVAVDPSEKNGRHLRNLGDTGGAYLVAEGSVEPSAFAEFGPRIFTFNVSDHHPWPWLRGAGIARRALRAWGSVATSAFDLVLKMGCDPVVFVGQDLAFTNGQPYCRGTTYEEDWVPPAVLPGVSLGEIWGWIRASRPVVTVPDVNGRPVETHQHLVAFRDWFVEQTTGDTSRAFVNATGGGILVGANIGQRTLSEALMASQPSNVADRLADLAARAIGCRAAARVEDAVAALRFDDAARSSEPLGTWIEFASGGITANDVRDALSGLRWPSGEGR